MLCSKLHCQKTFKLKVFSYKIRASRASSRDAPRVASSPATVPTRVFLMREVPDFECFLRVFLMSEVPDFALLNSQLKT